jgi:cell shape-determining protein MreC
VLFYAFQLFFPGALSSAVRNICAPFWKSGSFVRVKFEYYGELLRSKQALISNNQTLKGELERARMTILGYHALKEQYERLVPGSDAVGKGISATVLVRPPQTVYDTFMLDVGEDQGVRQGDLVYYSDTIIIGEITKTSAHSSEAQLFSTGNKESRVILGGKSEFTAVGKGGGTYEVRLPKEVPVAIGDSVIRPGKDLSIYGSVAAIELGQSDSFKKVYFRLPFNIHELAHVRVIPQISHE